jgi:Cu2+-containing amine oxidase
LVESGYVVWPSSSNPIWKLSYSLENSPDEEGIVIFDVFYKNHKVFWKASLPSLRVQYANNVCGPYKDPLHYNDARYINCGGSSVKVCKGVFFDQGRAHVYLQSYYTIGNYRLTQYWTFREDGVIFPLLWSAGLQCNANHKHHAYWRFYFDID